MVTLQLTTSNVRAMEKSEASNKSARASAYPALKAFLRWRALNPGTVYPLLLQVCAAFICSRTNRRLPPLYHQSNASKDRDTCKYEPSCKRLPQDPDAAQSCRDWNRELYSRGCKSRYSLDDVIPEYITQARRYRARQNCPKQAFCADVPPVTQTESERNRNRGGCEEICRSSRHRVLPLCSTQRIHAPRAPGQCCPGEDMRGDL